EAALRSPDAVALGVHVDEEAQDTRAFRRSVRAGVDVDQLVARARLELAAFLLDRPEARRAQGPAMDVVGHHAAEERFDALAVGAQNRLDAPLRLRIRVEARHRVRLRVIADVLRLEPAREAAQPREVFLGRQLDRAALEIHDLGSLERVLDLLGRGLVEAPERVCFHHVRFLTNDRASAGGSNRYGDRADAPLRERLIDLLDDILGADQAHRVRVANASTPPQRFYRTAELPAHGFGIFVDDEVLAEARPGTVP